MNGLRIILWIGIILLIVGCISEEINPYEYQGTKLIGHRGNGSLGSALGQSEENTVSACAEGFRLTEGVEVDVQRSNDYKVYMYHDVTVNPCGDVNIESIAASTSKPIAEYFDCLGQKTPKLKYLLERNIILEEEKEVFLDVKSIAQISTMLKMPTPQHYLNLMAQDLFDLLEDYPYKKSIHIESENAVLLNAFKKHQKVINTWLTSNGDFDNAIEKASKENYTGISIKKGDHISQKAVKKAHEKGLQICV